MYNHIQNEFISTFIEPLLYLRLFWLAFLCNFWPISFQWNISFLHSLGAYFISFNFFFFFARINIFKDFFYTLAKSLYFVKKLDILSLNIHWIGTFKEKLTWQMRIYIYIYIKKYITNTHPIIFTCFNIYNVFIKKINKIK